MNNILIHIPHSSYFIPKEYKELFYLSEKELLQEQLKMTDSYTNELFDIKSAEKIIFPISRIVCDVERFRDEKAEEMTKQGMWVCYTKTSDLQPLKKVIKNHKSEVLKNYYDTHHYMFENTIGQILKTNDKCFIIDAHSFSSKSLPYELHSQSIRPDICIGTDSFHTPKYITDYFYRSFKELGYNIEINNPFCGTIVPTAFYHKNKKVISIMVEVNRSLYMNEKTGKKLHKFEKIQHDIKQIIKSFQQNTQLM